MSFHTFTPIYQPRIWGGTRLNSFYQRTLPDGKKIGESWELVDRPEAVSTVAAGPDAGRTLHDLWTGPNRAALFGTAAPDTERFPILIKILDAADKLSLQVHPPAARARELGGEPKTEMWYFLKTEPDACIYAGLKKGTSRETFEKAVGTPALADCFHVLKTQPGVAMFLPSGRVHAIGAGNVILEIQQNSDTTYRVYDWDRVDDGAKPRDLHVPAALASINFNDWEPFFTQPHSERVLTCPYFAVQRAFIYPDEFRSWTGDGRSFQFQFLVQGELTFEGQVWKPGQGWLVSADHPQYDLTPGADGAELITIQWGE